MKKECDTCHFDSLTTVIGNPISSHHLIISMLHFTGSTVRCVVAFRLQHRNEHCALLSAMTAGLCIMHYRPMHVINSIVPVIIDLAKLIGQLLVIRRNDF